MTAVAQDGNHHLACMKKTALSIIPALAFVLGATGCSGFFKSKEAAENGVAQFHSAYNDGQFGTIYTNSAALFKNASTEKDFLDLLGAVKRKLGTVVSTQNTNFRVQSYNLTTTVTLQQNTVFQQGTATELFSFQMSGTNAILAGYHISSTALILKWASQAAA